MSREQIPAMALIAILLLPFGAEAMNSVERLANSIASFSENVEVKAGDATVSIRWPEWDERQGDENISIELYASRTLTYMIHPAKRVKHSGSGFIHEELENGKTYYYNIVGRRPGGGIIIIKYFEATPQWDGKKEALKPLDAPVITVAKGEAEATISWPAVPGAAGYNIYWGREAGLMKGIGTRYATEASSLTVTDLTPGVPYYFMATAVDGDRESGESNEAEVVPESRLPEPPAGRAVGLDGRNDISWAGVPGAKHYNLYYSTRPGVSKERAVKVERLGYDFTHAGLSNGTTYYYVLTAVDDSGESIASEEFSATPRAFTRGVRFWQDGSGAGSEG